MSSSRNYNANRGNQGRRNNNRNTVSTARPRGPDVEVIAYRNATSELVKRTMIWLANNRWSDIASCTNWYLAAKIIREEMERNHVKNVGGVIVCKNTTWYEWRCARGGEHNGDCNGVICSNHNSDCDDDCCEVHSQCTGECGKCACYGDFSWCDSYDQRCDAGMLFRIENTEISVYFNV